MYSVPSFGGHIAISRDVTRYPILVIRRTVFKRLFLGHRSLIKNQTQTAAINIVNKRILINLTFRMLDNIHFQK